MSAPKRSLLLAALISSAAAAEPVIEEQDWTESFPVGSKPTLTIDNIWGDVIIRTGSGDAIEMAVQSVRQADDAESFERSKELIPMRVAHDGDDVYFRVGRDQERWWNGERCNGCKVHADLVVTVPENTALDVRTVNDGDVSITGVAGRVTASNVNGSIATWGLGQCEHVETVNGDVEVRFAKSPASNCHIETVNGDIELSLSRGTDANFAVSLFNGKLRSNVDLSPNALPATVERRSRNGRTYYDIEQLAGLQLGSGGNTLTLKSLNGDVIVSRSQ